MANHALGVYYAPEHTLPQDLDYIAKLQPPVIRLLDPDVQQIATMHGLAPSAIIAPRTWLIDDNNGSAVRDLMADPTGTGTRHAEQYRHQLDEWQQQAAQRRITLPDPDHIYFNSANEPNQGGTADRIAAYSVAFLDQCTALGLRATAPCLGVGWPDNSGPATPVNWQPYIKAGLERAINDGGHMLELHEYFYDDGPQNNWTWWSGRHLQCPLNVPILLGEIGIDNYVDHARWASEGGNRGWDGNVSPDHYADMIEWHIRHSDTRVKAGLVFITDFRNREWASFNTRGAHGALLGRKDAMVPQTVPATTPPPIGPIEPHPLPPTRPDPEGSPSRLVHPLPGSTITQNFYQNPADYARFDLPGHNGTDFGGVAQRTPVLAIAQGVVAYSDFDPNYGNYVRIDHPSLDCYSFYAHLDEPGLAAGTAVNPGDTIGLLGSSGNSTGPHLHLEIRLRNPDGSYKEGTPMRKGRVDPRTWAILHGLKL